LELKIETWFFSNLEVYLLAKRRYFKVQNQVSGEIRTLLKIDIIGNKG
jgi:hypothetical protein